MALALTLIAGIFLLVGILLSLISKNKKNLTKFAIGLAFTVLLGMVVFDLIPEMVEHLESETFWIRTARIISCLAIGLGSFKIIDRLIPHHHEHNDKSDHNHLFHIGIVTSIALILHNIIEGIAIYSISLSDVKMGIMMCIGVALHNVPLGIEIGASLRSQKGKKINKAILVIMLTLSTTFGALILNLSNMEINDLVLGSLIAITLGMVLYLLIFELFKELLEYRNDKYALIGAILGIIIVGVSLIV